MVGNAPPRLDELRSSVRSMEVIRWYVEHKDEVQKLEDTIRRHDESAERAGVGKDLNAARAEAQRIVDDAKAVSRETLSEADKRLAQAEEVLNKAKDEMAKAERGMASLKEANIAHLKMVDEAKAGLERRKRELDERERKQIVEKNEVKMYEDRVRARESRLEAALRGP